MELISLLLDFILHIDRHLGELVVAYGPWIYLILFLIIFCETGLVVTPFLPGDSLLFVAGTLAALGSMNIHLLVALLIVAAILGDACNYQIGRHAGVRLFANPDSRIFRREYLTRTEAFYARHGGKTIVLARFVPIVRTFAPFVAGIGAMTYSKFILYNVIGGLLWVFLFTLLGYFFGQQPFVQANFEFVVLAIIGISVVPMIWEFTAEKMRSRKATAGVTE